MTRHTLKWFIKVHEIIFKINQYKIGKKFI